MKNHILPLSLLSGMALSGCLGKSDSEVAALGAPSAMSAEETRTTRYGVTFTRDQSIPELGEAWRDPSGMIWGDVMLDESGKRIEQSAMFADSTRVNQCAKIGARLPSPDDFKRLIGYFSKDGAEEYVPEVLPNLEETVEGKVNRLNFLTSKAPEDVSHSFLDLPSEIFVSETAEVRWRDTDLMRVHVRCVAGGVDSTPVPVTLPESAATTTGAIFTRNKDVGVEDAWKDPSGITWLPAQENYSITYPRAIEICAEYGGIVPSREDYERLMGYMGAGTDEGYKPQVLPDLGAWTYVRSSIGNPAPVRYWTSTRDPENSEARWVFTPYGEFQSRGNTETCEPWTCDMALARNDLRCVIPGI